MRARPGARQNPPTPTYSRFLVRPYAFARSPWEFLVAGFCCILLGAVFIVEVLTPHVMVGAFALLPLLAAIWMLSNRWSALVALLAILFLGVEVAVEKTNRLSLVLLGLAIMATALVARLYATSLASLLASHRHLRPAVVTQATPPTLDAVDGSSHGIRSLTRRELDVARLAAQGFAAAEIARRLHIGDRTVESHLASTYSKLRIGSRQELIRMASRFGSSQ